jgi:GBP family porin
LENGFNLDTGKLGQGSRMFGRQAWVGLKSDQYGSLTMGRQYDDMVDFVGPLSLTGTQYGGTEFGHPFDNDNLNNSFRLDNAVKYTSATYNGIKFGGLYALSDAAGGFSNNRAYSFGASYDSGPLVMSAAYMEIDNPGSDATGALDGSAASGDASFTAGRQRVWGGGVNYTYGAATAGFVFTQSRLDNLTSVNNTGSTADTFSSPASLHFTNYEVNGRYHLTPAWSVAASYTFTDGELNGASPKWNQFNVQTDYALSKRTDLYLQGEYQHQTGANGTAIAGASILGMGQSATDKQAAVIAGMRLRF